MNCSRPIMTLAALVWMLAGFYLLYVLWKIKRKLENFGFTDLF